MRSILLILCLAFVGFPGLSFSQLYKFYDSNGTLCFTDNYLLVPMEQRAASETIHEIKSKPGSSLESGKNKDSQSISGKTTVNKKVLPSELEQEAKRLESIRKELVVYYTSLKDRQDKLILDGKNEMTSKEAQDHNQKIRDLNQDTLKYKEKKQVYLKRLDEYDLELGSVY